MAAGNKTEEVTLLQDKLWDDLSAKHLHPDERVALLEKLKVLGRNAEDAKPIFTERGIETLARYAFDRDSPIDASREALRCLANALLLSPPTRQLLIDLEYGDKAAERLKEDNVETEFLISRILFLLTYGTTLDFRQLVDHSQLAASIIECIGRHAQQDSKGRSEGYSSPSITVMALSETLKLAFNILHFNKETGTKFQGAIPSVITLISRGEIMHPPLQPPLNHLINFLITINLKEAFRDHSIRQSLFPRSNEDVNIERLTNILDTALTEYSETEYEQITPVIALLRNIYEVAPESVRSYMQKRTLPTDSDRFQPLGKSGSLSSRLLALSSSNPTVTLRESVLALMFEMSDKDAGKFIQNVGYGFAAGFLANNQIPLPQDLSGKWKTHGDSEDKDGKDVLINPITGQRLDAEPEVPGPSMTEEEKEREAERLFVLFERLKKTGIVDVKNPVEEAIQQGRFEELD